MLLPLLIFSAVLLRPLVASSVREHARDITSLTAVTFRSGIEKREDAFILRRGCDHHYADHNSILRGVASRYATTSMKYSLPTISLEDIEPHIADIKCSTSKISVEFRDYQTLNIARESWDATPEFFVISSHAGCNNDGERAPYIVSNVVYAKDMPVAILSAKRIGWDDAYHQMSVSFGISHGKYAPDAIRLHTDLRKRQLVPTGAISYPSLTATPTATGTATKNLDFQFPPGKEVFKISHEDGAIEESITVSCKNCSTGGIIDIAEGVFTVNGTTFGTKAINFVEHGYMKAVANGLNAHVELDTTLSLSTGKSFNKTIAQFTIPGFQVPGIASVGPMLDFSLTGDIEIAGDLDFTYGFDLTVPDNSSVLANIRHVNESSYQGFNDAQIAALPLTASSPDFSLTLGLGLVVKLLVGISILDDNGNAGAGMFINLPHLDLTVSQVNGVNADCEAVDSSTTSGFLSTIFPNLTHVVLGADIDVGLSAQAGVDIDGVDISFTDPYTLAGTSFPLPTTCLMWDGKSNAFTTPTTTASTTAGATGTGSPGKKTSLGAKGVSNPILEWGTVGWTLGLLLGTLLFALSL